MAVTRRSRAVDPKVRNKGQMCQLPRNTQVNTTVTARASIDELVDIVVTEDGLFRDPSRAEHAFPLFYLSVHITLFSSPCSLSFPVSSSVSILKPPSTPSPSSPSASSAPALDSAPNTPPLQDECHIQLQSSQGYTFRSSAGPLSSLASLERMLSPNLSVQATLTLFP